jgi:hypothetical protein
MKTSNPAPPTMTFVLYAATVPSDVIMDRLRAMDAKASSDGPCGKICSTRAALTNNAELTKTIETRVDIVASKSVLPMA